MDEYALIKDELIGRTVHIKASTDPTYVNRTGTVIDETKNTFLIDWGKKPVRIAKNSSTFAFDVDGTQIIVKGSRLIYRPEERTKKAR